MVVDVRFASYTYVSNDVFTSSKKTNGFTGMNIFFYSINHMQGYYNNSISLNLTIFIVCCYECLSFGKMTDIF